MVAPICSTMDSGWAIHRLPHLTPHRWHPKVHSHGRLELQCRASKAPTVKLDFLTAEGPSSAECESGDILRDVMLDHKIDLYTTWGKVWTCGGSGQCGTCVVKVIDGSNLLSDRNTTEKKKLKKKPESYRLACQLNVGDGTNSGRITFQTKPP